MHIRFACLLLLLALLCGCERARTLKTVETVVETVETVETVVGSSGKDRLIRKDWVTAPRSHPEEKSYDSHSLVWQRLQNDSWLDHITISQGKNKGDILLFVAQYTIIEGILFGNFRGPDT